MLSAHSHASYHALPSVAPSAIPLGFFWTEALSPPLLTVTVACCLPVLLFYLHTQNLNFFDSFYLHGHLGPVSTGYVQGLNENNHESSSAKQNFEQFGGHPLSISVVWSMP